MNDVCVHICRPGTMWERRVLRCPVCHHRGRVVGMVQVWYDTRWTCCTCGDSWEGGYICPRPVERGWRDRARTEAQQRWVDGASRREVSAWINSQLGVVVDE